MLVTKDKYICFIIKHKLEISFDNVKWGNIIRNKFSNKIVAFDYHNIELNERLYVIQKGN